MKYIIFILLLISFNSFSKEELYKPSPEVIEARDSLLKTIEKMYAYIDSRILELSNKNKLNFTELQELHALKLVRYGSNEDRELYLKIREFYKKNPPNLKIMEPSEIKHQNSIKLY